MGAAAAGSAIGEYIQGVGYLMEGIVATRAAKYSAAIDRINAQSEVDALENQALQAEIVAQIADQDAQLARQATAFATRQQRTLFARAQGQTRAAIGASGVRFEGTSMAILAEQSYQAGLELWKTQFTGQLQERAAQIRGQEARYQAELLRFGGRRVLAVGEQQARLRKFEADVARVSSYIQVAGSVVRGVSGGIGAAGGGGGGGSTSASSIGGNAAFG